MPARHFRETKLAPTPRRARGFRMIRSGAHRVRLALLPGGGTRAITLLHPIGENLTEHHRRRCRVCGKTGHDRRKHRRS